MKTPSVISSLIYLSILYCSDFHVFPTLAQFPAKKGKALLPLNEKTRTNRERQKLRMARAESDRPRCHARYEAARNSKIEMIHQYKSDMWRTASAWKCLR